MFLVIVQSFLPFTMPLGAQPCLISMLILLRLSSRLFRRIAASMFSLLTQDGLYARIALTQWTTQPLKVVQADLLAFLWIRPDVLQQQLGRTATSACSTSLLELALLVLSHILNQYLVFALHWTVSN